MGQKTITARIDESLYREIKKALLDRDMTFKDWLERKIREELDIQEYTPGLDQ